jgi:valyl-tRNA synthetase
MPFVTEEVWQRLGTGESIVIAEWPASEAFAEHEAVPAEEAESFAFVQSLVVALRRFRAEHRIPPKTPLTVRIVEREPVRELVLPSLRIMLERLAGVGDWTIVDADDGARDAARLLVDGQTVLVPVGDLFDVEAELARLRKALDGVTRDEGRSRGRLGNDAFTANAPPEVVDKERARLAKLEDERSALREQIAQLESAGG